MVRTQIYLPPKQRDQLKALADRQQTTVSEVIRELIDEKFSNKAAANGPDAKGNAGEWLLAQADWAKKRRVSGPADLATRTDDYLYGGKK